MLSRTDSDDDSLRFYVGNRRKRRCPACWHVCTVNHVWQIVRVFDARTRERARVCTHSNGPHHNAWMHGETNATFRIGPGIVSGWSAGDYRGIITSALYTCDLCLICN